LNQYQQMIHVPKDITTRRHFIAGLVVHHHLCKADVLRWTDLSNGVVGRALKWLCKTGIIQRASNDSHEYAALIRARRTLGLEKPRELGGTPPVLFVPGQFFSSFNDEIANIVETLTCGRLAVGGSANPRQVGGERGKVHRIYLSASILKAPSTRLVGDYDSHSILYAGIKRSGENVPPFWSEYWDHRPEGCEKTTTLNGLRVHWQIVELNGCSWWAKWHVSHKGWRSVSFQLKRESSILVGLDNDPDELSQWLYEKVLEAVRWVELNHQCELSPKTSYQAFRSGVEVSLGIEDAGINRLLTKVNGSRPPANGMRYMVETEDGPVWLDQSPGAGQWEVETTLGGVGRLKHTRDTILQTLQDPLRDESHHLMMIEEFKFLNEKIDKIMKILEAKT